MSSSLRTRFSIVLAAFALGLVMVGFGAGGDGPTRLSISGRVSIDGTPLRVVRYDSWRCLSRDN